MCFGFGMARREGYWTGHAPMPPFHSKPAPPVPYATKPSVSAAPFPNSTTTTTAGSTAASNVTLATGAIDPFRPIDTNAPPSLFPAIGGHPQPITNIVSNASIEHGLKLNRQQTHQNEPLHTNKFYANLFLGSQTNGIFTTPYVLSWAKGGGQTSSYGIAVAHSDAGQKAFGNPNQNIPGAPASYFINPLGIQSLLLSANELGKGTQLHAVNLDTFSVNAVLKPSGSANSSITFPLVQGMGFVTGIYSNLQPTIQSGVFYNKLYFVGSVGQGIYKWRITLEDQKSWLLYVVPNHDTGAAPGFNLISNSVIQGPLNFSGFVQVAKNPSSDSGESAYDRSAGVYQTGGKVTGSVNGTTGSYTLSWATAGKRNGQSAIGYALPHLVNSFDNSTKNGLVSGLALQTTVKGLAHGVIGNSWTMIERSIPAKDFLFAPWTSTTGSVTNLSSTAVNAIYAAAQQELQQDIVGQSNLNSMYYSGKALSKFASIIYAVNDLCHEPGLAQQGLQTLKTAFNIFTSNKQDFPLYYDTVWKGIVSSASYHGGDAGADFGNSYYNDHHFHYGYFVHAAAIVGYLDPAWLAANKDWVNSLARDVSNPSSADSHFPVWRSFDWYSGHSLAKGLFESGDGKDEESTSEDVMFAYGLKLWGHVLGDVSMEARGSLMLAVLARSLQSYFLMESTNTNQPSNFIANKAAGITFENKIDHTTYFGANPEYVEGIHMIPLTPASVLTRSAKFVQEEWVSYFVEGAVADARNVAGGWKGLLYANLALIDPAKSFAFFNDANFDDGWLDGGASKTWYLAFAAGLGGA